MAYSKLAALTVLVLVVALAVTSRTAEAQTTASCAANLAPCGIYLNSTTRPPASCCDPLKQTVANDLRCLCNLYNTPDFLKTLGVNLTQALNLSRLCGVTSDLSACSEASAPTSPNSTSPPGVPGNDVSKIQSRGLFSFVLIFAAVMFY